MVATQILVIFTPKIGEDQSTHFWRVAYFSRWVGVKPPNQLWSSHGFLPSNLTTVTTVRPPWPPCGHRRRSTPRIFDLYSGGLKVGWKWIQSGGKDGGFFLMVETTGVPKQTQKTIEICHIDTYIWSYMPIYDLICICMHLMFLFLQKKGDASSKVWFFHNHVSFRGCIWSKRTAGIIQHGSEPPLRIPTPSLACSQDSSQWRRALGKVAFRSIVDV